MNIAEPEICERCEFPLDETQIAGICRKCATKDEVLAELDREIAEAQELERSRDEIHGKLKELERITYLSACTVLAETKGWTTIDEHEKYAKLSYHNTINPCWRHNDR